ncbi:hemopexin [Aplochiton taeniatus]
MTLLGQSLCLYLAVVCTSALPVHPDGLPDPGALGDQAHYNAELDRCDGIEFDAITPDEKGNTFFFKGDHLWKGFQGPAQLSNQSFKELDSYHHLGHIDAAFRMHNTENPKDHDHIYLFLEDKVFSYYDHVLEEGYPKDIQQDFPGVPSQLDAAVECPKGECGTDSVLFFKGSDIYTYDIATKLVKRKQWSHLPNCTAAFRWLEHYYCFHGYSFTRFHPVTGEVVGTYPKDARHYFMRCPNFGGIYMRLDSHRDGIHPFPIPKAWKEVTSGVDAVFFYTDKIYIIKGDQVYIYNAAAHFTLIEGYPKTLKEELGIESPVDAAFACANSNMVHIIQGRKMFEIDLTATPRAVVRDALLPIPKVDAALCGPDGVKVFSGSVYYKYESSRTLAFSRIAPEPLNITSAMLGCED